MRLTNEKLVKRGFWIVLFLLAATGPAFASCPDTANSAAYIRAGATGSGSGADWTNAYTGIGTSTGQVNPSGMSRGCTYYVAAGTYKSPTLATPNSGTSVITIKRATIASHGTATGWSSSYDNTVTWTGTVTFESDYWVFDGVTGAFKSPDQGFVVDVSGECSGTYTEGFLFPNGGGETGYDTISHWYIHECGPSSTQQAAYCIYQMGPVKNVTYSYGYCDNSDTDFQSNSSCDNCVFDHNASYNAWGNSSNHYETWAIVCNGCTISNNYVDFCLGTSCIFNNANTGTGCGAGVSICNAKIYGNVFADQTGGDCVICAGGGSANWTMAYTHVYNNTAVLAPNSTYYGWYNAATNGNYGNAPGNVVENNIIYSNGGSCSESVGSGTADYNAFYNCSNPPSETNGLVSSTSPFVSLSTKNFHLAADMTGSSAGLALAAPYNIDPDGKTRGADGTWDRGAYEFDANSGTEPAAPTGLTAVVH